MRSRRTQETNFHSAIFLIRWMVGGVFLAEGVQKFLFPDVWGWGRFKIIGIPLPQFSAPFVGVMEVACGALLICGAWTQVTSVLLLINLSVAIITTKIPMLSSAGFWATLNESTTDYCMLAGLIFLLINAKQADPS
jgi:putative oxidoreductase